MTKPNYESKWWGYIYDQMMEGDLAEVVERNLRFYRTNLARVNGPVLECACGTGLLWLPLRKMGLDMYGFDISKAMLSKLLKKSLALGMAGVASRVSIQEFEYFCYDQRFEAITIPTNTFSMLTSQEAQIKTLRNIYDHLAPGGRLLMDLRLAGPRTLGESPEVVEGSWYTWTHPDTGQPIRQRVVGRFDFSQQMIVDTCFIEYDGQVESFPMTARWIFKDEFQLLLRLAGFERWEGFGGPDGELLEAGAEETNSFWIIYRGE